MKKNKVYSKFWCFSKDTKILKDNGLSSSIETIKQGDKIISYNHTGQKIETVVVEKIANSQHNVINKIVFSNGITVKSTMDHPYWVVNKGWSAVKPKQAKENYNLAVNELVIADKCLYYSNGILQEVDVKSIEVEIGDFTMYIISGGKNNCFFADGILVHDENLQNCNLK